MALSKTKYIITSYGFLIGTIAVLAIATLTHFYKLGEFSFWTDEIYHVIAANSINQYGAPVFPSGGEYDRALPFTQTVAVLFSIFGDNEFVARIPSVASHLIFLGIFLYVMSKWFGRFGALLAVAVLSLSPYVLDIVRQCRMYGSLQLFNLLALIFAYWALNPRALVIKGNEIKKPVLVFLCATFFSFFLWAAYSIHLLALLILPGLSTFIALMALKDLTEHRSQSFKQSPYVIMTMGGILIMLMAFLLVPDYFYRLYGLTQKIPQWAQHEAPFSKLFYIRLIDRHSTLLIILFALGVLWLPYRYKSVGIYIVCLTVIPFALHSIFFAFKGSRYIFTLYPFIILIATVTLADILIFIGRSSILNRNVGHIFGFVILGIFLYKVIPTPSTIKHTLLAEQKPDWRKLKSLRDSTINSTPCYFTTSQNLFYYYTGFKPDYFIRAYADPRDAEYLTGAAVIKSLEQMNRAADNCGYSIIIANKFRMRNPSHMTPETAEYIRENWQLQSAPDDELVIYSQKRRPTE